MVGPEGRVEGFEPQEYAVELALRNINLNRFAHVRINRFAVSSKIGKRFLDTSRGAVAASIVKNFGGSKGEMVPVTTLDTFAKEHLISRVDLIKMDIEGAEFEALLGAQHVINAYRPVIVLEAADGDAAWVRSRELLMGHEYETYAFAPSGDLVRFKRLSSYYPSVVFIARNSSFSADRNFSANAASSTGLYSR